MQVWSLGLEDPLEEGMATHSSILAWSNPMNRGAWQATVHRITKKVGHNWSYRALMCSCAYQPSKFILNESLGKYTEEEIIMFLLYSHSTSRMFLTQLVTKYIAVGRVIPYQIIPKHQQGPYNFIQIRYYLPGDSTRTHRSRTRSHKTAPTSSH